jgi:hypothetical protein
MGTEEGDSRCGVVLAYCPDETQRLGQQGITTRPAARARWG